MSDKNVILMDELLQTITQTDEWEDIQANDPAIHGADKEMSKWMLRVKDALPRKQYDEVERAIYDYVDAIERAAILYGMHIIDVVRDVSARPSDLSQRIMERTGRAAE